MNNIRQAMRIAAERGKSEEWPRRYYWAAVWWRLHARESKNSREVLGYSRNQMLLYRDIKLRPEHYKDRKRPHGVSDWQWSGLGKNKEGAA